MKFYHCFYTDLPDEFVEAHAHELVEWVNRFDCTSPKYLIDSVVLEGWVDPRSRWVVINPSGHGTGYGWDRLHQWMRNNKGKYSGGYWKSLTEDQRDPYRAASASWRNHPQATVTSAGAGVHAKPPAYIPSPSLTHVTRVWMDLNYSNPKPVLKREVKLGEVTGYRCWKIENGLLRSVYQKDIWQPGQILEGRELEDWGHRGIHSWKEPGSRQFLQYLMDYLAQVEQSLMDVYTGTSLGRPQLHATNTAMVTGSVLMWGDVVEHEHGYRGEFAKVKSIDWLYPSSSMMGREREVLDDLRKQYGV